MTQQQNSICFFSNFIADGTKLQDNDNYCYHSVTVLAVLSQPQSKTQIVCLYSYAITLTMLLQRLRFCIECTGLLAPKTMEKNSLLVLQSIQAYISLHTVLQL